MQPLRTSYMSEKVLVDAGIVEMVFKGKRTSTRVETLAGIITEKFPITNNKPSRNHEINIQTRLEETPRRKG